MADRTQFLLDRHNKQVIFKGQSKGDTLPQLYRIEIFGMSLNTSEIVVTYPDKYPLTSVNGNAQPTAASDWMYRRDAIKQVLERACIKLGYLDASSENSMYNIIVEGSIEDEDEIRQGLGREDEGELREVTPLPPGLLRGSAEIFDEPPTEGIVGVFVIQAYLTDHIPY